MKLLTNKYQWVPGEIVTAGQVVKAIILNGLGFVSPALHLGSAEKVFRWG
ncbi:hypothetical protein MICAB_5430021 [Microcystis aeruginosa PCC 9717]|uniref:DUF4277 domain-containing protein n=1 Tax=Microcystis aeruginosa PCC 9717 TaxID=1160286 RepID=I4FT62_MICAE|nr:hypothetical protein MICAB_5430021 [Microcystis aeruginosa PCC 9717]